MTDLSLRDLSKKLADIDICMLITRTEGGELSGRPMSNNGQVEYDGDSYHFTWEEARMVDDIERDKRVGLSFQAGRGPGGDRPFMMHVEGEAELIRDKAVFKEHWSEDIDKWFENGIDTPGIVLIKVHATRIHWWEGTEDGEVKV